MWWNYIQGLEGEEGEQALTSVRTPIDHIAVEEVDVVGSGQTVQLPDGEEVGKLAVQVADHWRRVRSGDHHNQLSKWSTTKSDTNSCAR